MSEPMGGVFHSEWSLICWPLLLLLLLLVLLRLLFAACCDIKCVDPRDKSMRATHCVQALHFQGGNKKLWSGYTVLLWCEADPWPVFSRFLSVVEAAISNTEYATAHLRNWEFIISASIFERI